MQSLHLINYWLKSIKHEYKFRIKKILKLAKLSFIWHFKHNPYFFILHYSLTFTQILKVNRILNWANANSLILFNILSLIIHKKLLIRDSLAVFTDLGAIFFIIYHFINFYEIILTVRLLMDWTAGQNPFDSPVTSLLVELTEPYFRFFSKYSSSITSAMASVVLLDQAKDICKLIFTLYVYSANTCYHELGYTEDFEFLQRICRHESFKFV